MRSQQIVVREGAFDAEVWEAGEGDPLLYLHGEGRPAWGPFLDALAEKRHLIAPLHPGYGGSTGTEHLQGGCIRCANVEDGAFDHSIH